VNDRVAYRRATPPAAFAVLALLGGCAGAGPAPDPVELAYAPQLEVDFSAMERTASGLWIEEIAEGVGRVASQGVLIRIHYVAHLPDGTLVDGTLGGEPFEFRLGGNDVIRGWNQGIVGMQVGGRRRLVIRPGLAYGARGRPPAVPPNSVLVFEIQLVDVV
jgi:FKBP-type peptidyl-prolyl cis-trans isomerase